jgi:hypothetical protein
MLKATMKDYKDGVGMLVIELPYSKIGRESRPQKGKDGRKDEIQGKSITHATSGGNRDTSVQLPDGSELKVTLGVNCFSENPDFVSVN